MTPIPAPLVVVVVLRGVLDPASSRRGPSLPMCVAGSTARHAALGSTLVAGPVLPPQATTTSNAERALGLGRGCWGAVASIKSPVLLWCWCWWHCVAGAGVCRWARRTGAAMETQTSLDKLSKASYGWDAAVGRALFVRLGRWGIGRVQRGWSQAELAGFGFRRPVGPTPHGHRRAWRHNRTTTPDS